MDCKDGLVQIDDGSVDLLVTDPPYGISMMGKSWDRAVPPVEIWEECLRILKPGAFAFVMSIPRQDCLARMIVNLEDAGFEVGFTSIYHAFASGLPKCMNISKAIDRRAGVERKIVGQKKLNPRDKKAYLPNEYNGLLGTETFKANESMFFETEPATEKAKEMDGFFAGFNPKPALEVILVAMKPLSERTYVDQALANNHGGTWLGDCHIPRSDALIKSTNRQPRADDRTFNDNNSGFRAETNHIASVSPKGSFPANLLVSNGILDDGIIRKSTGGKSGHTGAYSGGYKEEYYGDAKPGFGDVGGFSRYFDLDKWFEKRMSELPEEVQRTFPFLITPKPSKAEKNKGLEGGTGSNTYNRKCVKCGKWERNQGIDKDKYTCYCEEPQWEEAAGNSHPTVKSIKLMSYLTVLGSVEGDIVIDPYAGSGSTLIACKLLNRKFIGFEKDEEGKGYVEIAEARLRAWEVKQKDLFDRGG